VIAVNGVCPLLAERMRQRLAQLPVFGFQVLDALGSNRQSL
jgi:hypothetical protein